MHIHYCQHVPFEGLASIEPWLQQRGHRISGTRFYAGELPPAADAIDGLIILGGPMSVNDEQQLPWLIAEKQLVKQMIDAGKPVLGICLGAQMIANVLGARVYPNAHKEIGWFALSRAAALPDNALLLPEPIIVLHWHGETFDLPENATLLASSAACRHQAFQYANKVIGLQFHLEMTADAVEAIASHCANELTEGAFIQSAAEILGIDPAHYTRTNALMGNILQFLFG